MSNSALSMYKSTAPTSSVNQDAAREQYERFLETFRRRLQEQAAALATKQKQEQADQAIHESMKRFRAASSMMHMGQAAGSGLPEPGSPADKRAYFRTSTGLQEPGGEPGSLSALAQAFGVSEKQLSADLNRAVGSFAANLSPTAVYGALADGVQSTMQDLAQAPASTTFSFIAGGLLSAAASLAVPAAGVYNIVARVVETIFHVELPTFDDFAKTPTKSLQGFLAPIDRFFRGLFGNDEEATKMAGQAHALGKIFIAGEYCLPGDEALAKQLGTAALRGGADGFGNGA